MARNDASCLYFACMTCSKVNGAWHRAGCVRFSQEKVRLTYGKMAFLNEKPDTLADQADAIAEKEL